MLSFDNPVTAIDIKKVKVLKDLKVFLLTGFNNDRVVVKADSVTAEQVKSANWAMKSVDRRARVKALTPGELVSLKAWADNGVLQLQLLEATTGLAMDPNHPLRQLADSPGWDAGTIFYKMEPHTLVDVDKAYQLAHRPGPNKPVDVSLITDFATSLKATDGLEKLGEIIAVDLFNDYVDRFYPGGNYQWGRQWKAIVNLGNVFMSADANNKLVPTGLDFLNTQTPAWKTQVPGANWAGHLLSDVPRRRQFANDVIEDLEFIFSPIPPTRRTLRKPKPALGYREKAVQRLIDGMRDGVKKLIIRTRQRGDKLGGLNKLDAGLYQRYNFIQKDRTDI